MKRLLLILFALLCIGTPPAQANTAITHVVVIAMENHSRSAVIGSAPYITSLAKTYGEATNYTNLTHPSLPNYMAVTGGSTAGITTDCSPSSSCGSNGASIFSQVTWKSYQESMKSNCQKTNASPYAVKHNPAAYYRKLTSCSTNDVPLGTGTPDISKQFTFITPNLCHDMHDCSVSVGDSWLKGFLPKLLNTTQYKSGNTAIFIWFDEGSGSGNLPFVVVSLSTHGVVYKTAINHYDTLFTIERVLGVGCLLNSCGQTDLSAAFGI